MTTLSTLSIRYELSTSTRDTLGADALSLWDQALTAELEKTFPGCDVDVTVRWASLDASRFDLTGETDEGEAVAGGKAHVGGVDVYDGAGADLDASALLSLARSIEAADAAAWVRACDLANAATV